MFAHNHSISVLDLICSYNCYTNQFHVAEFRDPVAGVCGLENLGNTCFVNAGVQCLFSVTPFCRFFLGRNSSKKCEEINNDIFLMSYY